MKATLPSTTPDYSKLIGVPYEKADCWKIVRMFYSTVFQVELKALYDTTPDLEGRQDLVVQNVKDFVKVDKPQFGDILLINVLGVPSHVGVYLDDMRFLHTIEGRNCTIDRIFTWRHKIEGFYRWQPSN